MLRGLANFAMQGRWQAALMASLLAVAAMLVPPLNYLASGIIALATLRTGPREGVRVLAAALIVFAIAAAVLFKQVWLTAILFLSAWLPVYLVTLVLGYTRSLAKAMKTAAVIGLLGVLLVHLFLADPTAWWQQTLAPFMQLLTEQDGWQLNDADTEQMFVNLAGIMTGLLAAAMSFNIIVALLIGRAWQASLYDAGAFGREFTHIVLGKPVATVTAILMLISVTPWADSLPILVDSFSVLLVLFVFQGIAVVHAIVRERQKSTAWLVVMYVLLVIMLPQMATLLATLGITEQWFNFRKHQKGDADSIDKQ
jgi:hypothetical protein